MLPGQYSDEEEKEWRGIARVNWNRSGILLVGFYLHTS